MGSLSRRGSEHPDASVAQRHFDIHALMGDAPRQRGSIEACTLMQLQRGMSSTFWRRICPKAATTIRSGASERNRSTSSSGFCHS